MPSLIPNSILLRLAKRTAQLLKVKQEQLAAIRWTDGESNTESGFSSLACSSAAEAWTSLKADAPEFADTTFVATSPDIRIKLLHEAAVVATGKIELKSGKGDIIPGSTIAKVDMNQATIYCKRGEATFDFRYGQYHSCIGDSDTDMFQDRSPRPHVNFKKMTDPDAEVPYVEKEKGDWVKRYAECAVNRTEQMPGASWQDDLTAHIINEYLRRTSIEEISERKNSLVLETVTTKLRRFKLPPVEPKPSEQ